MDRLGGRLRWRDGVQRRSVDLHRAGVEAALGGKRFPDAGGIVGQIQPPQHIGEARFGAAAVDQDLPAGFAGGVQRQIDRQPGIGQQARAVIFARHRALVLLLMELEEQLFATRYKSAVERVEAVDVGIDDEIFRPQPELFRQQPRYDRGGLAGAASLGEGAGLCNRRQGILRYRHGGKSWPQENRHKQAGRRNFCRSAPLKSKPKPRIFPVLIETLTYPTSSSPRRRGSVQVSDQMATSGLRGSPPTRG